jgi:nucleoid-associated protein YgaU
MLSRSLILTVGGLAAAAVVASAAYWFVAVQPHGAPPVSVVTATFAPTPSPSVAAATPAAQPSAAQPSAATPATAAAPPIPTNTPAFDVVRVEPTGDAVVAGRAAPGARVDLSDDGKTIGDPVVANDAGQFVILPPTFSPGRHPLRLSAKVGDGAPQVSVVVVVEVAGAPVAVAAAPAVSPTAAKPSPTVAATPTPSPTVAKSAPPTPVATPAPSPAASASSTPTPAASAAALTPAPAPSVTPASAPTAAIAVAVASVRPVDPAGLEAVGSAPPGAHVRLRLNNAVLAEVIADADGAWRLTIERGVTAGDYVLEAAVVDAAGAVLARAESPFVYPQREAVAAAPVASPTAPPAAVEPTPAASAPAASTPAASAPAAATPAATTPAAATPAASAVPTPSAPAAPSPSPSVAIAAAEPTSAPSAAAAPVAPAPAPSVSAVAPPSEASVSAVAPPSEASARAVAPPAPSAAALPQTPAASETPTATTAHAVVPEVLTYSVVKGDNLWDLAVKYYGDGLRYADIFSANASQIHDPNLIYIGQIFVVPAKPTTTPSPAR